MACGIHAEGILRIDEVVAVVGVLDEGNLIGGAEELLVGTESFGIISQPPGDAGTQIQDRFHAVVEEGVNQDLGGFLSHAVDAPGSLDQLEVRVEINEKIFSDEVKQLETLRKRIQKEIESTLNIVVSVKLVEPRTIERSMGKAVRVIDNRELYQ